MKQSRVRLLRRKRSDMYSAIVVDDESIIRNGISSFINGCGAGFEVTETFKDGGDAIKFLEENDVDLVISDVKMINVSGIELAQYIYENKPYIMVVILSGYAEFEYAKAAIRFNVRDYMTKPTSFADLKKTLLKLREELDERKRSDIDEFLDNIKQLYTALLSGSISDAKTLFRHLLDSNTHGGECLGRYAFNIFEIISDHLYAVLRLEPFSEQESYNELPSLTSYDEVYELSEKLLDRLDGQIHADDKKTDDMVLSKLLQYIDEHFAENISLQDAAEKVFFSTAYCSRFFKEKMGKNFSDYLLDVRMKHAVKLLRANKKITDIGKECGYRNASYFARVFREYYNCTPSEYVRNL